MYIPKQRDIVWIDFNPSRGKEIKKVRPALVISRNEFNTATGFCIVCPISSTTRSHIPYVPIADPQTIQGEVSTHQIRSLDYRDRKVKFIERIDLRTWLEVLEILEMFIWNDRGIYQETEQNPVTED